MSQGRKGAPGGADGPSNRRPAGGFFGHRPLGMPGEKAKDFKGNLRRLARYVKPYQVQLFTVLGAAILSTIFSIVSPKILGKATTKLFEGLMPRLKGVPGAKIDFGYIWNIILILIGLYLVSALFSYIQQWIMAGVAQKTVYSMRKDVNEKLARLPLKFFDSHTHGEIMSRVTNDIENISTTLQQSLTQLITSIVTIIGILVMMLTISPVMTLIALVTLPLSVLVTTVIAKRSQRYFASQQATLGKLNGHVEEMYTGHQIVKAFGYEGKSVKAFGEINQRLYDSGWKAQFVSGVIMPFLNFINNIGYVLVSVIGGILVTKRSIEIGDVQAFIQYSRQFMQPITQTANIANILQSTVASAERVFELLDEPEEVPKHRCGQSN